jgi:hypothetical protein
LVVPTSPDGSVITANFARFGWSASSAAITATRFCPRVTGAASRCVNPSTSTFRFAGAIAPPPCPVGPSATAPVSESTVTTRGGVPAITARNSLPAFCRLAAAPGRSTVTGSRDGLNIRTVHCKIA